MSYRGYYRGHDRRDEDFRRERDTARRTHGSGRSNTAARLYDNRRKSNHKSSAYDEDYDSGHESGVGYGRRRRERYDERRRGARSRYGKRSRYDLSDEDDEEEEEEEENDYQVEYRKGAQRDRYNKNRKRELYEYDDDIDIDDDDAEDKRRKDTRGVLSAQRHSSSPSSLHHRRGDRSRHESREGRAAKRRRQYEHTPRSFSHDRSSTSSSDAEKEERGRGRRRDAHKSSHERITSSRTTRTTTGQAESTTQPARFVVAREQQARVFDFLDRKRQGSVLGPRPEQTDMNTNKAAEEANEQPANRGAVLSDNHDDYDDNNNNNNNNYAIQASAHGVQGEPEPQAEPQNITRVVLYGVDRCVTPAHINSIVEQLLGCVPWRVRRPAQELLALQGYMQTQQAPETQKSAALLDTPQSPLLSLHEPQDEEKKVNNVGEEMQGTQGILPTPSTPDYTTPPLAIKGNTSNSVSSAAMVNAQSMLPGLFDVNRAGGMVVLEFASETTALRVLQLLNGAVVNGRPVVATL